MDFKKYKNQFLNWVQNTDFSRMNIKTFKKISKVVSIFLFAVVIFLCFEVYMPLNPISHETITYTVEKGWGNSDIASELESMGIIRSKLFFRFYTLLSFNHTGLMAGRYLISPNMSIYKIVKKMVSGDMIEDRFIIYEGWSEEDIGEYLGSRNICTQQEFLDAISKDYSLDFMFLQDKPKDANLEGYLFPDTYEVSGNQTCEDVIKLMLGNFEKKLTDKIQEEIKVQKKTIFEVVTMASLLEKEVRTLEDKKIVSGILWKRLEIGMALQLDSTVNYATGKSKPSVSISETKIDSPYNTYKYAGLPIGPICNPGIDSIIAALTPIKSNYLYYLSDGKTYYAKTLEEHVANKVKYLQ